MPDYDHQYVADYIAIQQLSNRYARVSDEFDGATYATLYTEDGEFVIDRGEGAEPRRFVGPEQLAALCNGTKGTGFHVTSNPVVEIEGDRARQVSRLLMMKVPEDGKGAQATMAGTYTDELVRTPQGWKFKSRRVRVEPPS
jgi:hypothetical protein